jgi:hypothetical protein
MRSMKISYYCFVVICATTVALAACTDDPIEKCVTAQIKLAEEVAKTAANRTSMDWDHVKLETPKEVEARARLQCLKAGSGRGSQ